MFVVRPAQPADVPALLELAGTAEGRTHTLPRTATAAEDCIARSEASFATPANATRDGAYLFVLETPDESLAGAASLCASAGARQSFLAFREDAMQQASPDLDLCHTVHTLMLSSDLSPFSQLCGFCLRDAAGGAGRRSAELLSRARLLFAAMEPARFGEKFFAALPGISDRNGASPFWDAVGRHFFGIELAEAERRVGGGRNRSAIVEVMPHYPMYVSLLPQEAREALGVAHPESQLPLSVLAGEGFEINEYVDLFDGGPILLAARHAVRTIAGAVQRTVACAGVPEASLAGATYLVGHGQGAAFRAVIVDCPALERSDEVILPAAARRALGATPGDSVTCVGL